MAQDIMVTLQKLANENTAKTFEYNTQEAKESRKWQEQMSNTAHQREVKDLIAAGLNPVLSAGGSGAASYSTSSASATADSAVNAIGNVESSRTGAAATRYAANQSLRASQAMANAQMYAAYMNYQSNKYNADMQYKIKQDFSVIGVADKAANAVSVTLLGKKWNEALEDLAKAGKSIWKNNTVANIAANNDFKSVQDAGYALSGSARQRFTSMLHKAGVVVDEKSIGLVALYAATGLDSYLWALKRRNELAKKFDSHWYPYMYRGFRKPNNGRTYW